MVRWPSGVTGRLAAEAGDARDRVAGRAAGGLQAGLHLGVERRRLGFIDQLHRALGQAIARDEGVFARCDHVDDGVEDSCDVVEVWHCWTFRRSWRGVGLQKIAHGGNVVA
jgi:hypothetical protein